MSKPKYRACIIGLGFIGGADQVSGDVLGQAVNKLDGTHFASLKNNHRVELVAGSSRNEGRRERFAERSGVKTYADWSEMLEKEKPDIVGVATYSPVHAEITIACAEHGARAVLCEKPIATTLPDAEKMVSVCEKADTLLVINHQKRFNPNYRRLRDLSLTGSWAI